MRTSLASATSLLALLLLEGPEAVADPILKVGTPISFSYNVVASWEAGSASASAAETSYTFMPLTSGAASTQEEHRGPTPYFMIGASVLSKLASSATKSTDAAGGRPGTQGGAASAGNSVFVGTSGNSALLDSVSSAQPAASASYGYTIPQAARGAPLPNPVADRPGFNDQSPSGGLSPVNEIAGSGVRVSALKPAGERSDDDVPSVTFVASSGTDATRGKATGESDESTAPSAGLPTAAPMPAGGSRVSALRTTKVLPGYTYTPLSGATSAAAAARDHSRVTPSETQIVQTATSTAKSAPVNRVFLGSIPSATVFKPRTPADGISAPSGPGSHPVDGFYLTVQPKTGDAGHYDTVGSLTVAGYRPASADVSVFRIAPKDTVATPNAGVPLPTQVVGASVGELPSSLAIFTADSAAGVDSLSFSFDRAVPQ